MADNTVMDSSKMENDAQPNYVSEPKEAEDDIGGAGPSTIFSHTVETTESHLGDDATFSGEPENDDTSDTNERIEQMSSLFLENHYGVKICGGGTHFRSGDKCYVEMEDGKEFYIELSNNHNYGCDVDIQMARLALGTEYEDVGGWRLDPGQENFEIRNSGYGQGKFMFYGSNPGKRAGEENKRNEENLKSILKIKFSPEAYSIYFRLRNKQSVINVRMVKTEQASLLDVLERWVEKNKLEKEDFSEWCFYDGEKLHRSRMRLSTVAGKQSIRNPLRLLRAKEKISVKLNGGKTTEIDVEPLELHDHSILLDKLNSEFGEADYEMKVGDKIVTKDNYLNCFEVDFVEVTQETKKTEAPKVDRKSEVELPTERAGGFRGLGLTRGFNTEERQSMTLGSGYRGISDDFEREEEEVFRGGGRTIYRTGPESTNEGFVRYEGPPVQAFEKVVSNPQFYTSHDDQVVVTIHLVTTS